VDGRKEARTKKERKENFMFVGREPPKPDIQCYHPRRPEKSKKGACNAMQGIMKRYFEKEQNRSRSV
jgi:hypothetical protein